MSIGGAVVEGKQDESRASGENLERNAKNHPNESSTRPSLPAGNGINRSGERVHVGNQYFINHTSCETAGISMTVENGETVRKQSYTIPCASGFRTAVGDLAARRGGNVADLVRSVVLVVPPAVIAAFADPGGPPAGDRETVILKSGKAKGQPLRRKPRLQVRLGPGHEVITLRRALGLALALDRGDVGMRFTGSGLEANQPLDRDAERLKKQAATALEEVERLRAIVSVLSFDPLAGGIQTRDDALHILNSLLKLFNV